MEITFKPIYSEDCDNLVLNSLANLTGNEFVKYTVRKMKYTVRNEFLSNFNLTYLRDLAPATTGTVYNICSLLVMMSCV